MKKTTPIRQSYESSCFNSTYRTMKKKIKVYSLLEERRIPDFNFAKIESAGTFKSICTFIYCERENYTESAEVKVSVLLS